MKVLQINTSVNTGSTGRVAENLGKLLISRGHESYIAYGRGNSQSQSKLIKIGSHNDIIFHVLKTRISDRHAFGSKTATINFTNEIESIQPDIIILHNIHGYYLNIEILFNYLRIKNIPVVWTLFDCWAFTGHCSYFDDINCTRWMSECYSCPKSHQYPRSYFIDNSLCNYRLKMKLFNSIPKLQIIVHSAWLGSLIRRSFFKGYPTYIIPNGIDLDIFKPNETTIRDKFGINDKKFILGCANVWDKRKGFEDFLRLEKILDKGQIILLVGLTDKQIKKLPQGIIGIKRTENIQELAALYTSADVFVNPTWQDNFPTTNLEALACGTPVVTYNTGGSPEAIDANTGITVDKGNIEKLYEAINTILEKGKSSFSDACRKRAEQHYNFKDRLGEYITLFHELVKDN